MTTVLKLTWHPGAQVWSKVIGKQPSKDGNRLVQAQFYFTANREESETLATARRAEWKRLKATWQRSHGPFLKTLGDQFHDTPHWYTKNGHGSKVTAEAVEAVRREADTPTQDEIAYEHRDVTVTECAYWFGKHRQGREGTDFDASSNRSFETDLKGALGCIDTGLLMRDLQAFHVDDMRVNLLKACKSPNTALNYGRAFKMMLEWYYGSPMFVGGIAPKGIMEVFDKFPRKRPATPNHLSAGTLKLVLSEATDRRGLYLMLMLNTGMQATDIPALEADAFDLSTGTVRWFRQKNDRLLQPNDHEVISHLWPETVALVRRFIAPSGLAFRQPDGKPLSKVTAGRNRNNAVAKGLGKFFIRLNKRKGVDVSAKNFRQTGAQLIQEVSDYELSRVWLGRPFKTVDKPYLSAVYQRLAVALVHVRERLASEGVLSVLAKSAG